MKAVTENTAISIGLLMAIVGSVGFVFKISFQGEANAAAIVELRRRQDAIEAIQWDIAVIKTKVDNIEKRVASQGR